VISAGAIMNIILGFLLSIIILAQANHFTSTTIENFKNPEANRYQFEEGDRITSVNGYKISTFNDLNFALGAFKALEKPLDIKVNRQGRDINLDSVKFDVKEEDNKKRLDTNLNFKKIEKNFVTTIVQSYKYTVSTVRLTWKSFSMLLTGKASFKDTSGPVGIISQVGQVASIGLTKSLGDAINNVINFMMLITVNLGIFNLLPFPALDGGRLVFLLLEAIRRKPIDPKHEGMIHAIGLIIIFGLMIILTFKDILNLIPH
jgi:regulator of sigma E protease